MVLFMEAEVLDIGLSLIGKQNSRVNLEAKCKLFLSHFGSQPIVLACLWERLQTTDNEHAWLPAMKATYKHFKMFLLTNFYIKGYHLEDVVATRFGVHMQTVRKWVAFFLEKFAALLPELVIWPEVWETEFIISVDCVNFGVNEPRHAVLHKDKRYFDRKGGKAGLLYKIVLDLWNNQVVWFNGPFPPNDGNNATIYKTKGLMERIPEGKLAIADKIYVGCDHVSGHNLLDIDEVQVLKSHARARQESFNARLKTFGCLKQRFCHGVAKHETFACAVCVIVILQMMNGSPLSLV